MPPSEHPLFDVVVRAIQTDIAQLVEYDVETEPLTARLAEVVAAGSMDALLEFQMEIWQTPQPDDYPYEEPSDPDALRARWPTDTSPFEGGRDRLCDKIAGAWLGRAAGCCLGKPFEMNLDRHEVEALCIALDSWPLLDYVNTWKEGEFPQVRAQQDPGRDRSCTRGVIDHCPNDDDLNYPIAGLLCLEECGPEWTAPQLHRLIADLTPYGCLWSSGKNGARAAIMDLAHPAGQLFGNPTRQSLGAMIRCDTWAYVSPGNIPQAADFALRDAVFTQTRNGIYAGIFWAVAIADAMGSGAPAPSLERALRYVPPRSRFAEMVTRCFELRRASAWEHAVDEMYERYSLSLPERLRFNHSLINSALVILGILYGDGDFSRTIGLTVSGGRDTDCTGAAAGSLMGAAYGQGKIPESWYQCLNDTYRSVMKGCHEMAFSDLIARTEVVARRLGRF